MIRIDFYILLIKSHGVCNFFLFSTMWWKTFTVNPLWWEWRHKTLNSKLLILWSIFIPWSIFPPSSLILEKEKEGNIKWLKKQTKQKNMFYELQNCGFNVCRCHENLWNFIFYFYIITYQLQSISCQCWSNVVSIWWPLKFFTNVKCIIQFCLHWKIHINTFLQPTSRP